MSKGPHGAATSVRHVSAPTLDYSKRWVALAVLCAGVLMIVLGTTVVNVALPSIREDLKFSETSLVWVVNAYMLTFGGSLLIGGRLGDMYGHRRLFLVGIVIFTIASPACALANWRSLLIAARAVQGLGGAIVMAVSLSLITNMFSDPIERAKAVGAYGFVSGGGSSIGLLLGGALTSTLGWHWIFLVNVPIGTAVFALGFALLPKTRMNGANRQLDVWGAVTMTVSLMIAIYALVNGNEQGWTSIRTLGLLGASAVLLLMLVVIEASVPAPLIPLGIFRLRNLAISNIVRVLWAVGVSPWFFISALYMHLVLGYGPMHVALAFLPANAIMAVFSLGLSATLVTRFGLGKPLGVGMLLAAIGLTLLARAPVDGRIMTDVLPGMTLLGLGAGISFNPMLLAAMNDVTPAESGLASGIINTAAIVGSSIGLAILASLSASRADHLLASGAAMPVALTGGYRVAFLAGAVSVCGAALVGAAFLRTNSPVHAREQAALT